MFLVALAVVLVTVSTGRTQDSSEALRFTKQPARAGDAYRQHSSFRMQSTTTYITGGESQLIGHDDTAGVQLRQIQLVEATPERTVARVKFDTARERKIRDDAPEQQLDQPVTGKSYLVSREGETLRATYLDGRAPPDEEREIVEASLDALGRSNPLSDFLGGRAVAVGETLELPATAAHELLKAWRGLEGETKLALTLVAQGDDGGVRTADFQARLGTDPHDFGGEGPIHTIVQLRGTVRVEVDTCRVVAVDMSGPVSIVDQRPPPVGPLTVSRQGTVEIRTAAQFDRRVR